VEDIQIGSYFRFQAFFITTSEDLGKHLSALRHAKTTHGSASIKTGM
jgi:hypothetical protein